MQFPLGQKHYIIILIMRREDGKEKGKKLNLLIGGYYTKRPKVDFQPSTSYTI